MLADRRNFLARASRRVKAFLGAVTFGLPEAIAVAIAGCALASFVAWRQLH